MKTKLFTAAALLALCSVAYSQGVPLGGPPVVESASKSIDGAETITFTSDGNCVISTSTNCTVTEGASVGQYVATYIIAAGTITAPRTATIPIAPGRRFDVLNLNSYNVTITTPASGLSVVVPPSSTVPVSMKSFDGTNLVQTGGTPGAATTIQGNAGNFTFSGAGFGGCTGSGGTYTCTFSGGTGSGTVNAAAQYSPAFYGASGTTASVQGVPPFTGLEFFPGTAAPRAAASADVQGVIGSGVYDASGAAAGVLATSLQKANNLSDLANAATARTNLGLGAAATHGASITINGSTCTLDGSCAPSNAPPADIKYSPAAVCDGGTAYASGLTRFDNQQPQAGCLLPASSTAAYLAYNAGATIPQYATATIATPTYWTGTSLYIKFAGTATTGNVGWIVDTACTNDGQVISTASFGTPTTVTTTVSSTLGATVTTAIFSNIGVPGTNGCTAGTTIPGSLLTYRITRSATDTQAGNANLLGVVLVTGRSQ